MLGSHQGALAGVHLAARLVLVAALGGACTPVERASEPPPGPSSDQHVHADARAWSAILDDPGRDAWQRPNAVLEALELAPEMIVADVGAGTGYFSVRLARAVHRGQVIATDVEPDMVRFVERRAREHGISNLRAVRSTPSESALADASVDRIVVVHVWHHVADRAALARDLARALRPAGRLFIIDFDPDAQRGPPRGMRLAPSTVIEELERAGLSAELNPVEIPHQYIVEARHHG